MVYDINHPVFVHLKNYFSNDPQTSAELDYQMQLMNHSPLLMKLLSEWEIDGGGDIKYNAANSNGYNYTDILIHDISGTNFIRILGHELGHFFDEELDGVEIPELDSTKKFKFLIDQEMAESTATAISYIINRQIVSNSPNNIDIGISNKIFASTHGNNQQLLSDLDNAFGSSVSTMTTIADLVNEVGDIAKMIWGNNFPLKKTPTEPSRWEKLLVKTFGADIPEFLQSNVRTFESAIINQDGKYEFHFTEQKGTDAGQDIKYIYESNSCIGDSNANLLVVGANDHNLTGGAGNDVLVANWTRLGEKNSVASFLDGGAGDDKLYGGESQDTLDGGLGDDHLYGMGGNDTHRFICYAL